MTESATWLTDYAYINYADWGPSMRQALLKSAPDCRNHGGIAKLFLLLFANMFVKPIEGLHNAVCTYMHTILQYLLVSFLFKAV